MIKNILIDLDGTILDFKKSERQAFIESFEDYVLRKPTEEEIKRFSELNDFYYKEYQNGNISRDRFHDLRFKTLFEEFNINEIYVLVNEMYMELLAYKADIYNDTVETLLYLKEKGYRLCVASNGLSYVQAKRLKLAGLSHYFNKFYVSEDLGFNKPDINFFNLIFKDLNDNNIDNYVIIGDRLDSDIIGGKKAGIKTIYINRDNIIHNEIIPDYEIKELSELRNIL